MDDFIDKVGKVKYVTEFHLLKGFWQVLLTEYTKEISAFVTPQGLYQYKVMLFAIKKVITDLEDCKAYIDDVIIFSDTCKKHWGTTCEFFMHFLATAGYYRRFCSNFATVTEPLTQLLGKKVKICLDCPMWRGVWGIESHVTECPCINSAWFKLPVEGVDHPVWYFSKKFNNSGKNYSTIEIECLALVLEIQHFEIYVSSSSLPVVVCSDHNPFVFMHKLKAKN